MNFLFVCEIMSLIVSIHINEMIIIDRVQNLYKMGLKEFLEAMIWQMAYLIRSSNEL